jgi:hypothetical protein
LRTIKIHDNISGTFQSEQGATRFATIRSYLQTAGAYCRKLPDACGERFTTGAWLPLAVV